MTRWKLALINQKNYLVWLLTHHQKNLFARSSDVISQGNHAVSVSRDVCFFVRLRYRVQEFHPLFWQTVSAPLDIRFVKLSVAVVSLHNGIYFKLFLCFSCPRREWFWFGGGLGTADRHLIGFWWRQIHSSMGHTAGDENAGGTWELK